MKNRYIVVLLLSLFVIVGCQTGQTESERTEVTVAEFGELFIYAPLYVAQERGYFEANGLEVTIFAAGGPEKTFAALLSGDAQFGVADPTFVAISGEQGKPGVVIAGMLTGVPFYGVAKNDVPTISKPEDLKPFTVGTHPSPSTGFTLQSNMFALANLQPNIRELAPGTALAALAADEIDIALELEPAVSTSVSQGNKIVYSLSEYYPEFAITGVMVLPEYVEENPQTAQAFVQALHEAMQYTRSHPDDVADLLTRRFPGIEHSIATNAVQNLINDGVFPQSLIVSEEGWQQATQARITAGHLTKLAPYEQYVDMRFVHNVTQT